MGWGGEKVIEKVIKKVIKKVINRRKRSQTPFTAWVGAAETPEPLPKVSGNEKAAEQFVLVLGRVSAS